MSKTINIAFSKQNCILKEENLQKNNVSAYALILLAVAEFHLKGVVIRGVQYSSRFYCNIIK